MWVTDGSGTGDHPNTGVETSHSSHMGRMGRNERQMTLFSPKTFQVGTGGDDCVGVDVHASEVGNDERVGKTNVKVVLPGTY